MRNSLRIKVVLTTWVVPPLRNSWSVDKSTMNHLHTEDCDAFGKLLPSLLGVWKMNNYFYTPSYQVIKLDTYQQEGLHTMK